jgi:DNA-binding NarL/FixJ family response regulator
MTITAETTLDILLVDDHRFVADSLRQLLAVNGFAAEVATFATGEEVIEEARIRRPRLVVLDLDLEGAGHGRDLIRPLRELGAAVMVLSGTTDRAELGAALEAGAVGVVSKGEPFSSVLDKIRLASEGCSVTGVGDRARLLDELDDKRRTEKSRTAKFDNLTRRERDVLAMIVEGHQAADIAKAAFVSLATVRTQIRSILLKLDVSSQIAAAAAARSCGWTNNTMEA